MSVYSKFTGTLSRLTVLDKDRIYSSKIDVIYFAFSRSSQCFLLFFVVVRDGPDQCPFEGDACNPPIDEACIPAYMNFLAIRSIKISSTNFSIALRSPNIHTRNQISCTPR
jgi:hypothetical protein